MSQNKLAKLRNSDVYKALMRVLEEYRIPKAGFDVLDKRPHPLLTVRYCGVERAMSIPSTPKTRGKAPVAYSAQLRRMLKEMQMVALGNESASRINEAMIVQDQANLPLFAQAATSSAQTTDRQFTFSGVQLRFVMRAGDPWFVAADVAAVLEIGRTDDAVRRLDDDEKGTDSIRTLGGNQTMVVINESGLYSLILTSRKDAAKRFKKWVTSEVIPQIRRTGAYGVPTVDLNDPSWLRGQLLSYTERVMSLEATVASQAPKVEALERISEADGSLCITDAAKNLQVQPLRLFKWLDTNGWTYTRPGTSTKLAYQAKINAGHLEHKVTTKPLTDGSERVFTQVRVTAKGLAHLAEIFPPVAKAV